MFRARIYTTTAARERAQMSCRGKKDVTDADKAVLSLKTQRRKLSAERTRLEGLIAKGVAEAREQIRAQRRERALLSLRKNKVYEHSLDGIDAYLLNVEQILANIESAQRNNRLFSALKEGNLALADLQKQVSLEEVEELNEQSAEAREHQERLRDLLAQSLSAEDDADALEELEKIQAEQEEAALPKVPSTEVATPSRPETTPPQTEEELPTVPSHKVEIPDKSVQRERAKEEKMLAS